MLRAEGEVGHNWTVRVLERDGATVSLHVQQDDFESGSFFPTRPFAFRLLMDSLAGGSEVGSLRTVIPQDAHFDGSYAPSHAADFIAQVSMVEEVAAYDSDQLWDEMRELHSAEEDVASAVQRVLKSWSDNPAYCVLRVVMSDSKWVDHLSLNQQWISAAYA